jgi:hypothetical protein
MEDLEQLIEDILLESDKLADKYDNVSDEPEDHEVELLEEVLVLLKKINL